MRKMLAAGVLMLAVAWVAPAPGQIFIRKVKPSPAQRVPELIMIAKTDVDERKRIHAVEELRDYDPMMFTEIVPALADVLQNDKKPGVRMEAITSLAKIRPVNAEAGQALERASAYDDTFRVRLHAKAALTKYHLAGYSARTTEPLPASRRATFDTPTAEPAPPANPAVATTGGTNQPRPFPIVPASAPPAQPMPTRPSVEPPPPLPMIPSVPAQGPSLFP